MSLRQSATVLRQQWVVVLVCALVGLAAAGAAHWLKPPQYTAELQLYASAQIGDNAQAAYQGAQISEQRASSYVAMLNSERVATSVQQRLGLPWSPADVAARISATSVPDSVLLKVTASDASPQRAADIVNAVGEVFPAIVAEAERPATPNGRPSLLVRVVDPADAPTEPSSPGLAVALVAGLLLGLAVGVAGALARNALDRTVRTPEALLVEAKAPNLGVIGLDPGAPRRPLAVLDEPQSPRSEGYRQLRTNLRYVDVDRPPRVIVVTSSVAGESKSTSVANLALALAFAGHRVLVVDADLRRPAQADLFGLEGAVGLTGVLAGQVSVEDAIQRAAGGVDVLCSGVLPPNPSEMVASRRMSEFLADVRTRFDVVLVDTPPLLLVTDAAVTATGADGTILVCRAGSTTVPQFRRAVEALDAVSARLLGTVLAMAPTSGPRGYGYGTYRSYYRSEPEQNVEGADSATMPRASARN